MKHLFYFHWMVGWLVSCLDVLRTYNASVVFHPYHDLEARNNQYLKSKWRGRESNSGALPTQAKSLAIWNAVFTYIKLFAPISTISNYFKIGRIQFRIGRI